MIAYDYKVHISGGQVRVEAFDCNRSMNYPAFEIEVGVDGPYVHEYYLCTDDSTCERKPDCIPTIIRAEMLAEIEDAMCKMSHARKMLGAVGRLHLP